MTLYDADDHLVASARGRPPEWLSGIHGAELWALFQGTQLGPIDYRLLTDCKAVLLGAQRGTHWANESRRTFSRAWGPVAIALEDNHQAVVWTPAHCTGEQVAYRKLSDGSPMRQRHRLGNAQADTQAKQSAADEKLPSHTLKWIATNSRKLLDIAMWIGRCTHTANHFRTCSGDPPAKAVHIRDCEGLAATRLQRYKAGRKRKREEPEDTTPVPGDLSLCPRWQRLRQRILDKAKPPTE